MKHLLLLVAGAALLVGALTPPARAKDRCVTPPSLVRLTAALPRVEAKLRAHEPITIVAIGSSSTAGYGASAPAKTYPSRLAAELAERLPHATIEVRNKGVSGETSAEMLKRFDTDVLSARPDLVIWQVGTNSVIRDLDLRPHDALLREGIDRLKAAGIDVILMDMQYAPSVISHPHYAEMERILAETARDEHVAVFGRFAIMRYWVESGQLTFKTMLASDRLHLNDRSYGCVGRLLAEAIVDRLSTSAVASGR
jgi:acyl-CoA thioesterase-1